MHGEGQKDQGGETSVTRLAELRSPGPPGFPPGLPLDSLDPPQASLSECLSVVVHAKLPRGLKNDAKGGQAAVAAR